jgi:hypothetical protein
MYDGVAAVVEVFFLFQRKETGPAKTDIVIQQHTVMAIAKHVRNENMSSCARVDLGRRPAALILTII